MVNQVCVIHGDGVGNCRCRTKFRPSSGHGSYYHNGEGLCVPVNVLLALPSVEISSRPTSARSSKVERPPVGEPLTIHQIETPVHRCAYFLGPMSDDQSSQSSPATTPSSARPFMPLPLELNGERRKPSKKLSFQGCQGGQAPVIPDPTRERIRMQATAGKLQIAPNQTYDFTSEDMIDEGEIGRGAFGAVNRMKFTHTGTVMAVKRIRSTVDEKEQKQLLMDLEVVMKSNDCNTIVTFYGALFKEGDCWICMELMDTSLDKFYKFICEKQQSPIPEPILAQITFATVRALNYLKEELKIIHRDVKPSNILLKRNGDIKLCDFGISGQLVDSIARTKDAGCRPYMAPERIDPQRAKGYDVRSDVWSLGITLMEVATGKFPYPKWGSVFEQLSQVVEGDPPRLSTTYNGMEFSIDFVNFVNTCLIKDERDRPKYGRLLQHPFIQQAEKSDTDVAAYVSEVLESMANNGITQFTTDLPAEGWNESFN
uniref:mitogen-activated protein kinase kinase n=1 Tax=Anopheles merus TaxID=30066 RepID=A0A182UT57_ANOME